LILYYIGVGPMVQQGSFNHHVNGNPRVREPRCCGS
jgi:hypothetical protein